MKNTHDTPRKLMTSEHAAAYLSICPRKLWGDYPRPDGFALPGSTGQYAMTLTT